MNIFERASRNQLRFATDRGELTTEQLWQLPLTARGGKLDLDTLAQAIALQLRDMDAGSFVKKEPNQAKIDMELRLEILKHIIESKLADEKRAEETAVRAERKRKLLAALNNQEDAALASMSRAEIEAEIAKL